MSADLREGVRQFIDGGAPPIRLDEVVGRRSPTRHGSNGKYAIVAATAVLAVVALIVIAVAVGSNDSGLGVAPGSTRIALTNVPAGVSVQQVGQRLVFVVRNDRAVNVFDTDVHHLPGERGLWWCPAERIFVAPTHAETFNRAGDAIGGPATAGLNRYYAVIQHQQLIIDPTRITRGRAGNRHTNDTPDQASTRAWDSGPGSFCAGALRSNNATSPSTVLTIGTRGLRFDQQNYTVPMGLVQIRFTGASGLTFTFDDPRFRYCLLDTSPRGTHSCRVQLGPGQYLVYDAVPGHRAAGLEATITVTSAQPTIR
jgi:hypothetical protein